MEGSLSQCRLKQGRTLWGVKARQSEDLKETPVQSPNRHTGLGLETAVHLARLNPVQFILVVRGVKKGDLGEAAKAQIISSTNYAGLIEVWGIDMEEFNSVTRFAERANKSLDRLDGALLNAGINPRNSEHTVHRSFGHATTTSPARHDKTPFFDPRRIPNAASFSHDGFYKAAAKILPAMTDPAQSILRDRYPTSKLFLVFLTRGLGNCARRRPGLCVTEIGRDYELDSVAIFLYRLVCWSTGKGALNLLYAALTDTPSGVFEQAVDSDQGGPEGSK
ncbi:hypothetical protein C8J57DRAFT_1645636 [Mycena rebaudengoi]|nr:hypothetical protein C8J57DRAFT_1645636 [Mycena rebaudengoi]